MNNQFSDLDIKIQKAIKEYQCPGCCSDCRGKQFRFTPNTLGGLGCGNQIGGTITPFVGNTFLGMPKGFNRLGSFPQMKINIYPDYKTSDWQYDMYNVPVWKYLNKAGHTIVRGLTPRTNIQFIHVFLTDCRSEINCLEITQENVDYMD